MSFKKYSKDHWLDIASKHSKANIQRLHVTYDLARDVASNDVPGDIVQTGVFKGGTAMAMMTGYASVKDIEDCPNIYLFDTFKGMPKPDDVDKKIGHDTNILEKWEKYHDEGTNVTDWCYCSKEDVEKNLDKIPYPKDKIHYVEGLVEKTIPKKLPKTISILYVDTDFYSSTKHTLIHAIERIYSGGVIIFDDYNAWEGAQKAVHEFLKENDLSRHELINIDKSAAYLRIL